MLKEQPRDEIKEGGNTPIRLAGAIYEGADGPLRHAIAHFENEFRELEIAAKAATEAREKVKAHGGVPGTDEWTELSCNLGAGPLVEVWNKHDTDCAVAIRQVFAIPAQTIWGIKEKFRLFKMLAYDNDAEYRYYQSRDGEWVEDVQRDLKRLVVEES